MCQRVRPVWLALGKRNDLKAAAGLLAPLGAKRCIRHLSQEKQHILEQRMCQRVGPVGFALGERNDLKVAAGLLEE